jgi:hypothetical protein
MAISWMALLPQALTGDGGRFQIGMLGAKPLCHKHRTRFRGSAWAKNWFDHFKQMAKTATRIRRS